MPEINPDLHGSAPDKSSVALLLIDVINHLEFEDGPRMLEQAVPMGRRLADLKRRARAEHIPCIYVNDNFGKWRSDFHALVEHCLAEGTCGRPLAELLRPHPDDYFVLKPKHSGFFNTPLEILLRYLEVRTLILTGITADICVLFTANDAYMRDYRLFVPRDCVASLTADANERALGVIGTILKADTRPSAELDLPAMKSDLG